MLKAIIFFILSFNLAYAGRFDEADKKKFIEEVKQEIAEHKLENNGKVDLQIIKPEFYKGIEEYQDLEKFTKDEMVVIKQRFENLSKDKSITPENAEAAFYKFLEAQLEEINQRPIPKVKEGEICNNWRCEKGFECAPDPMQKEELQCKASGKECKIDADCCSNECIENPKTKARVCEDVYRCYRPLSAGQACVTNPVCGEGSCLPFNSLAAGMGECSESQKKCQKNSDCCSNLCGGGVCRDNFICKNCVPRGKKVERGKRCCEGLIESENGYCIPDVPPTIIPQVRVSPVKSLFIAFVSIFLPSAEAGVTPEMRNDFNKALEGGMVPNSGDTTDWANGTLTRLPNGHMLYENREGGFYSKELSSEKDIEVLASQSDDVREHWVEQYGVDVLGTKDSYVQNKNTIDILLSQKGPPNTQAKINVSLEGDNFIVYDKDGAPTKVILNGTEMSSDDFLKSKFYEAAVGKNDANPTSLVNLSVKETIAAADKASCEAAITQKYKDKTGTCSLGGSCNGTNPTLYGICTDGSDLAYIPGKEPKSEEQVSAEEDSFLTTAKQVDNSDIVSTIKGNENKYGAGFIPKSDKFKPEEKKIDALKLTRSSNFETCEMRFKDDFMNYLKKNNLLELEMALLGFDFVMAGDGVNDYWVGNGGSIYSRLKEASKISKEQRAQLWEKVEKTNKELTCTCLDVRGFKNIKLDKMKEFFKKECAEYAKYENPETATEELEGDASGVKGKRLLVQWTGKLAAFNRDLVVDHSKVKEKVSNVLEWMDDDQKWNETEQKTYPLFSFHIKNPSGSVAALGAILGALLAAGVIAIMGGFGTASILTAWGAAGIITASAVTGAGGLWMISSLRGAWITKRPEISDRYIRSYGCGKKDTCVEYSRELKQPYNNICKVHTSANACVKDFLVIREFGKVNDNQAVTEESTFLVDPWVPYNISQELLIKDSNNGPTYADKMELGFQAAKEAMIAKNPGATGGGGKKGGGQFVPESYLSEVFLDPALVGKYVPQLGSNLEEKYFLRDKNIQLIKKAAIKFALDQKFFEEGDKDNLNIFAEYAYEYHFVYPKRSRHNEISYPAVGLKSYVDLIANKVLGNLSANAANAFGNKDKGFTNLNLLYLTDYENTLGLYDKATNGNAVKKTELKKELDAVGAEIDRLKNLSSLVTSPNLDSVGSASKLISDFNSNHKGAALSSADSAYVKAIGQLRSDRKNQVRKFEHYKKAIAARGDKERDEKMSKASSSFGSKFSSPISTAGKSKIGSGLAETVTSAENANKNSTDSSKGSNYGASFNTNYGAGNSAMSQGSNVYGSSSSSKNSSTADSASAGSGSGNGVSDEDSKRLSDAIDARDRAKKGKYQSEEGQSLFEKVTNAYIRNYDKVLSKKKDKDVVESNK